MPFCDFCDRVAATVEMRRRPGGTGWKCKDTVACRGRVLAGKRARRDALKAARRVAR